MQIDRRALDGLLAMNDAQLMAMIRALATKSGIDPADFNIDASNVRSIRSALSGATDKDLERVVEQYKAGLQKAKGQK